MMKKLSLESSHIAIEGAIGVGKTTLVQKLAHRLNGNVLLEGVEDNPFIELFYQDPSRHALSVQLSFLFSRVKQWQQISQLNLFKRALVSDYVFAKDRLFARLNLSDEEFQLYEQVSKLVATDIAQPDLVIYLQSRPEVIMQRVRQRSRPIEKGLSLDYLRQVMAAYDEYFFHYYETPLLIVQTDKLNFAEDDASVDALLERVSQMRSPREFWAEFV
ncbi:MAG: deoxynucleoside kinase [Zetaproteobacteria bacterium CG_4_9_14_3_um_filter_49_83]|nr:MAG: deoxynucleoside kinase [Zetaproteobacteria bacterium CG17_big_fil_post_rev_8_21_14_2_50_50_13]PIV29805.1 MAG: deoxynucleoside kinase [Zetaproteobacteria bacterium CG02_land_8_20_14_3_00_50_9]PIY54633.1 MAG: deoxynucleoside kinase [Zetaproteobacteria bacterium CG_4_10_14_0_8_um_filter_49_80]PJA35637.1 MAG: deoxynucleoside kinase [Zetaproteobacteria bacterium CG_4_9_14_3_um_filter_49_83]